MSRRQWPLGSATRSGQCHRTEHRRLVVQHRRSEIASTPRSATILATSLHGAEGRRRGGSAVQTIERPALCYYMLCDTVPTLTPRRSSATRVPRLAGDPGRQIRITVALWLAE